MQVRREKRPVDGLLLLDKPQGISSNAALLKCRWLYGAAKAGHTGTLDPMATGLLPVCFGEATKFAHTLLDADKTYEATLQLGIRTDTGDAEGQVCEIRPVDVDVVEVEDACRNFVGCIEQIPPMYSALKHAGKPLYEYARAGQEIERAVRSVHIYAIEIIDCELPHVRISVRCSKGTYIRTLAEDIGARLGCGAHLSALRRTRVGSLDLDHALTLEQIEAMDTAARLDRLGPVDALLGELPIQHLEHDVGARFMHGQAVTASSAQQLGLVRVVVGARFVGLGKLSTDGLLTPVRLLACK